jgi:tripartite-type tricarboxylate transporter receptor subunit TctC
MKTNRLFALSSIVAFALGTQLAEAQQPYPSKPIREVVPFAAGGPADILARWLGNKLTTTVGQPIIIDNKGGAGGLIGAQAVATAPPDGYTYLFASVGAISISPYIADKIAYDPDKDLTPVIRVVTAPTVLVTAAGSRFNKLSDLVTYAKANPGKVTFASAGIGTTTQLGSELLMREAGIQMVHVPYKGAAPAITDVLAGTADVIFADVPVVLPYVKAGKLKVLTVGTPARLPVMPDVPTTAEAGFPNVLVSTWYGVLAPAKTPRDVIMKFNNAMNTVMATPEAKTFFAEQGVVVNGGTPEDFGAFIRSESKRWPAIAKAAGVKLE